MELHTSGEDYLEAVLILSRTCLEVRSVDIAEHLGVSRPSVSRAVSLLRRGGFLEVEGAGHIVLPIVSIAALAVIDWRLALASLVTFPFSFICMGLTFKISGENFSQYERSSSHMNSTIVEYIEGIEVIKAFGRAGVSYEKYSSAITDFRTFVVKWLSSTFVTMKLSFALFPSTLIGTLPVALALALGGSITAPQAALAVMLSMSMVGSLAKLEVFSENMRQVKCTVDSLEEFLDMPELPEPAARVEVKGSEVVLGGVRFSYTGNAADEVLHGIDLRLPEGSFTALVGPSGGGKSTVAKLIARFWDVGEGSITVGGVNVKDMPLAQLSEYVSFVTQDNYLFRCSRTFVSANRMRPMMRSKPPRVQRSARNLSQSCRRAMIPLSERAGERSRAASVSVYPLPVRYSRILLSSYSTRLRQALTRRMSTSFSRLSPSLHAVRR